MTNNRRTQLRALLSRMRARYTIPTEPPPPDPRHRDRAGRTPLHYAVTDGPHDDAYRRFAITNTAHCLAQPGIDVNAIDDEGLTPLHGAARHNFPDVVQMLLTAGAIPNPQSRNGTTPLYIATRNTSAARLLITRLLLEAGADPTVTMFNGSSALTLARRLEARDILDMMAEYGYR